MTGGSGRSVLGNTWIAAARLRRRAQRRLGRAPAPREALVRRHAPGASFADIGCMWGVDGAIAFLAEESGATAVTGLDSEAATDAFEAEHSRRGSSVRFVQGDLHEPAVVQDVGVHDVVWCFGVLYHALHPLLTLERLRALTGKRLILGTATIPEVPGLAQACVFYPGLPDGQREAYARGLPAGALGIETPFQPEAGYANWWWGITPSALRAMLGAAGFVVEEILEQPFSAVAICNVAATPSGESRAPASSQA